MEKKCKVSIRAGYFSNQRSKCCDDADYDKEPYICLEEGAAIDVASISYQQTPHANHSPVLLPQVSKVVKSPCYMAMAIIAAKVVHPPLICFISLVNGSIEVLVVFLFDP